MILKRLLYSSPEKKTSPFFFFFAIHSHFNKEFISSICVWLFYSVVNRKWENNENDRRFKTQNFKQKIN